MLGTLVGSEAGLAVPPQFKNGHRFNRGYMSVMVCYSIWIHVDCIEVIMNTIERIDAYSSGMRRLQRIWAYLLKRKMRLYAKMH